MSGGLRGIGQCPYSLAVVFLCLIQGGLLVHPFPCDGVDFSLRKPRWRVWRLQLAGVMSPFYLCLLLGYMELGGHRVREGREKGWHQRRSKKSKDLVWGQQET